MLRRFWKGRPRGLSELPTWIREAEYPAGFFLREALLSVDGKFIRLTGEDGRRLFWRVNDLGGWVQCQAVKETDSGGLVGYDDPDLQPLVLNAYEPPTD